ncbi:MAG TPA: hypothetical protein VFI95_04845 [Terriglobales bacterium]|nr:hypothetical protein [Terriglobales bacterium]
MADTPTGPPPQETIPATPGTPSEPGTSFNIGEEFGTAKRNLPPPKVLGIGLALVLLISLIVILTQSRPRGSGTIDAIDAVEVPDQGTVLAAINVSVHNSSAKPLWIRGLRATVKTDSGEFTDDAGSPVDFERYFQAFPALKQHAIQPLTVETKIQPGAEAKGTMMVSFPTTLDAFNKRKSLTVTVQPYDERPVEITQK